jgi:hypothetical protein
LEEHFENFERCPFHVAARESISIITREFFKLGYIVLAIKGEKIKIAITRAQPCTGMQ